MTDIPILLTLFNRPEKTAQVLAALRQVKPSRLFVAADGPRSGHPTDKTKCGQTRELLATIDWPCELKTLLRPDNLGCDPAVSSAIHWFFSQVDYGVILEDDCVPHPDFFRFCEAIFPRYAQDQRVMQISALSPYPERKYPFDYHFSRAFRCWGWGTWKRAWQAYDDSVAVYGECIEALLKSYYPYHADYMVRLAQFQAFQSGMRDNWDFKWNLACYAQNGLAVVPESNLVTNIGFDAEGTHTTQSDHWLAGLCTDSLPIPLRHPAFIYADPVPELALQKQLYRQRNFKGRLLRRLQHLWGSCHDFWGTWP